MVRYLTAAKRAQNFLIAKRSADFLIKAAKQRKAQDR